MEVQSHKRSHGEGSWFERPDGKWQYRLVYKGHRLSAYGSTKRECREKVNEKKRLIDDGLEHLGPDQTLKLYLERWLKDAAAPRLRNSTYRSYESSLRNRVYPRLGRVRLRSLTAQQLQGLYSELLAAGLAPRSVEVTHSVLHRALKQAFRWGLIPSNPADKVSAPRPKKKEMQTLTAEQVNLLLASAPSIRDRTLYAVAVTTGVRQGEELGLQWGDVDLDARVISVRRTLQWVKGQGLSIEEVKTDRSRRTISLSEIAVEALRKWRVEQKAERFQAGSAWLASEFVFTRPDGRPLEGGQVTERFQRLCASLGLRRHTYHDLRHTAATLLLSANTHPKVVQEMLGHATIAVTMDIYSHVLPNMQREAVSAFDRMLASEAG